MAVRIDIRPAEPRDADRIRGWRAAPAAWAALSADPHLEAEDRRAERQDWIVETDAAPVGLLSLYELDRRNARGAFALYVSEASVIPALDAFVEYWMLEYAFDGLKLAKLWCETPAFDTAACERHESFGFRRECCFRGHLLKDGAAVDVIGLGLLADEWRAHRTAAADRLHALGLEPPEL